MSAPTRWSLRVLAAAALTAIVAAPAVAQPAPLRPALPNNPRPPVQVMPQINTAPGVLVPPALRPAFTPFVNPALVNPWMNQRAVVPVPVVRPFPVNPLFNNPLAMNPLLRNPGLVNPLGGPGFGLGTSSFTSITPPVALQQPGQFLYQGPDLQVNPWSGTVYRPVTGVAVLADGSTFYRVPGSGLPNRLGSYATGSGLYYNPLGGTFFNPSSGVVSKPGQTTTFLPYVW